MVLFAEAVKENLKIIKRNTKKSGKDILANKKLGDKAGVDLIGADADSYFDLRNANYF